MGTQRLLRGMTLDSYRTVRLIARGGMGEVYEAVDQVLERPTAIKIMSAEDQGISASGFLGMFTMEARLLALVDHQNIVRVFGVGSFEGVPYIAMEYVDGFSLQSAIAREVLSVEQALSVFIPLFEALCCLHEQEIIHRDIKPANILIRRDGTVKLVDFGIAIRQGWEGTTSSTNLGTPEYTAPEAGRGGKAIPSSDLWSAGAVLFECLVGMKLSQYRVNPTANIDFPEAAQARIPGELRRIIIKLCMTDPHQRYQRTEDVVSDLMKLYRLNFPGPVVLSRVFKQNLVTLAGRVEVVTSASPITEDRTQAVVPSPKEAYKPVVSKPRMPTSPPVKPKSTSLSGGFNLLKGLALWAAVAYIGYNQLYVPRVGQEERKPAASAKAALVKAQFSLVEPKDQAVIETANSSAQLNLQWECVPGVTTYRAQVAKGSSFSEVTHERKVTSCEWTGIMVPKGSYVWRVRPELEPDRWTAPHRFTVK